MICILLHIHFRRVFVVHMQLQKPFSLEDKRFLADTMIWTEGEG